MKGAALCLGKFALSIKTDDPNPSTSYVYSVFLDFGSNTMPFEVMAALNEVARDFISAAKPAGALSPSPATISAVDARYLENIILAGMKSWNIVLSSLGRNAERIKPVSLPTGEPRPSLAKVSVVRLVIRVNLYGEERTCPSGP